MKRVFKTTAIAATLAASMISPASAEQLLCNKGGYNFAYSTVQLCEAGPSYRATARVGSVFMLVEVERTGANTADITCDGVVVHHCVYEHRTISGGGGGWSGGESLSDSRDRSAAREPGERSGSTGTTDTGESTGIVAISN